jgi:hypothetical protein
MQGEPQNHRDHLFVEEEVPNLRSVGVRRCSEKSTRARGLFGGLLSAVITTMMIMATPAIMMVPLRA